MKFDLNQIADPVIRAGVTNAIEKTLLPAAAEQAYPGHFFVMTRGTCGPISSR